MSNLAKALSVYRSCLTLDHKATTIIWAKQILTGLELQWFVNTVVRDHDFDLVLQRYREVA